jgi:hypothetical protein
MVFRPIHALYEQLRSGEIDSVRGRPVFKDWQGDWCEVVPALQGWADCWQRIADGEKLSLPMTATLKLANRLSYGTPVGPGDIEASWQEMLATQRAILRIPRKAMGSYMRTQQIADEFSKLADSAGVVNGFHASEETKQQIRNGVFDHGSHQA